MSKVFTLILFLFLFSFCIQKPKPNIDSINLNEEINTSKIINLKYDFNVEIDNEEDYKTFKTYTYFKLKNNQNTLFVDSLNTEYQFDDNLYPIVIKTGTKTFELLFEINDRPSKNKLKRFFIENNKVIKTDLLPTFISKAKDINNDGIKEYAGYWDESQVWGENNLLTAYNPILYYEITQNGLQLDSSLTIEKNTKIYGQFHGFEFSEKIEIPTNTQKSFDEELNLFK